MSNDDLKNAFTAVALDTVGECPPAERFWDAQDGALTPEEVAELVDHTTVCPACAMTWRLAKETLGERDAEDRAFTSHNARVHAFPTPKRRLLSPVSGTLAAVAVVMLAFFWTPKKPTLVERGASKGPIQAVSPISVPRDQCILSWELKTPEVVTQYELTVTVDGTLTRFYTVNQLTETTHQIPPERLADLPSGTALRWRVKALTEDGSMLASEPFLTTLSDE